MRLRNNTRFWEKLAQTDPLWAVLTSPDKAGNLWQIDEFFETGRSGIDRDLAYIAGILPDAPRRAALDFGCGVGRLSQALADHYEQVTGVDAAETMIALAQHYNRHPDRVRYLHNPAAHLRQIESASCDLVYTVITLQHIPTPAIRFYLKEFVRVCRPGGIIFFQLPSQPSDPWKFSFYPPTLWKRLRRHFRRFFGTSDMMQMNALPRGEVVRRLERAGARVVDIQPYPAAGHLESWSYLVTKD